MGKYEETLERARQGKPIGEVFPELKDEWIRKALITIVKRAFSKYGAKCNGDEIGEEDLLTYLEKQKEQKPSELERLDKLREMTKEIREAYERGIEVGRAESKQEWSKEDEKSFDNALSGLKYAYEDLVNHKSFDSAEDMKNAFDWLKALKPQPKQEWSEEDEDKADDICKLIEHATIIPRSGDDDTGIPPTRLSDKYKGELKAFVKSFHPHWKPSEEQMEALLGAEGILRSLHYDDRAKILASLYEQLKNRC